MKNEVILNGKIVSDFEYNHEMMEEKFYLTYISVQRSSGTEDKIPVMISEKLIDPGIKYKNKNVFLYGQYRSRNKQQDDGIHLSLYVFTQHIELLPNSCDQNEIILEGFICKKPTFRTTPFGRELSDILLAVPRMYGKSDYIPCICWGRNAHYASRLNVGDQVNVKGRIQCRSYEKIIDGIVEDRIAYEISATNINI